MRWWEKSHLPPTRKPLGPRRLEAGKQHGSSMPPIVYSACLGLPYVKGRKSEFAAGKTCLGPVPNPLHFPTQASTS